MMSQPEQVNYEQLALDHGLRVFKQLKVWKEGIISTQFEEVFSEEAKTIAANLKIGAYELPTGEIYIVKPNREKTRLYAKRLVEAPSERLTETGKHVDFDFVYEAGAIYKIKPENRMPFERAKELTILYGRCIICGRHLKVAKSVERGIGPDCYKAIGGE